MGQYFRPAGVTAPAGGLAPTVGHDEDAPAPVTKAAPAVTTSAFDDDEPVAATAPVSAAPAAGANKAEDILAMIRARQQK